MAKTSKGKGTGGMKLKGTPDDDVLTGGAGDDKVDGGPGDDVLDGGGGDDKVSGGPGSDGLQGGDGDDWVKGGPSDDVVDGGAGSDRVDGGAGNDLAIYNMAENTGAADRYDGGSGIDTLLLEFTYDEWMRDDVQADVARFLTFLEEHTDPVTGEADGERFYFESFDLSARKFEDFRITVDGVEQDPRDEAVVAEDDAAVTETEESAVSGSVLDNDSVPDLVRSVELVDSSPKGSMTFRPDGTFTYDPGDDFDYLAEGETEDVIFTYRVTDADHDSDIGTITITVTGTNDAPVAVADVGGTDEDTAVTIDVLANDTDVDLSDTHTVDAVSVASGGGSATIVANQVVYDPGADYQYLAVGESASVELAYTMSDNHGAESASTVSLTITGTNDGPVAVADGAATSEDTAVVIPTAAILANDTDVDASDVLAITSVGPALNGTVTLDTNGDVVFTPDLHFSGEASFAYAITDHNGGTATSSVTIDVAAVADAPNLSALDADTYDGDVIPLSISSGLVDTDGSETLTITIAGVPSGSVLSGGRLVSDDGTSATWQLTQDDLDGLTLLPSATSSGDVDLTITATATETSNGDTAQSVETMNVVVNRPPEAGDDAAATSEDSPVTVPLASLLTNDSDPDAWDSFSITSVDADLHDGAGNIVGSVVLDGSGNAVVTPIADWSGQASFTYTISDSRGKTDTATVRVDVAAVADAPTVSVPAGGVAGGEDSAVALNVAAALTDLDGSETLGIVISGVPVGAALSAGTNNGGGTWTLTQAQLDGLTFNPDTNWNGSFDLTVTATSRETSNGDVAVTTRVMNVSVEAVNDGPTANADALTTGENSVVTFDVLANDTDVDAGDSRTLTNVGVAAGQGAVAIVSNQVQWNPGTDFDHLADGDLATVVISYTMEDSQGAPSSSTLTLTVQGSNDAPQVVDSLVATNVDVAISGTLSAAKDAEGDGYTYALADGPAHGQLVLNSDGSYAYTPDEGYAGADTFTFTGVDTLGAVSVPGTVSIDVAGGEGQVFYLDIGERVGDPLPGHASTLPPDVTALADGGHLIVWTHRNPVDYSYENYAQRYDADSNPVGDMVHIVTGNSTWAIKAAGLSDGGHVIVWQESGAINAQRFDADGTASGGEFQVNHTLGGSQAGQPQVTDLAGGGFVVTWQARVDSMDTIARIYAADGTPVTDEFRANTTTSSYQKADSHAESVTALPDGGFVVAWTDYSGATAEVVGQRFASDGSFVGSEFTINSTAAGYQFISSMASLNDGGWVVTWSGYDGSTHLFAQRYAADGTAVGGEERIVSNIMSTSYNSDIVALNDGGYLITWDTLDRSSSYQRDIFAQRFDAAGAKVGDEIKVDDYGYFGGARSVAATVQDDGDVVFAWWENTRINTKTVTLTDDETPPPPATTDEKVNDTLAGWADIPEVTSLANGGHLVVWAQYGDRTDNPDNSYYGVYGQRYAADGSADGETFLVNSTTADSQFRPTAAGLADGSSVVIWQAYNQAGDQYYGLFGQRYDAGGNAVGGEFHVNQATASNQHYAKVVDLADGGFVVSWSGPGGLFARIYNADGTPQTNEFLVSSGIARVNGGTEYLAALADGGFVVTWEAPEGSPSWLKRDGIFGQRIDADGSKIDGVFHVNSTTDRTQAYSSVAGLADGGWVVAWSSAHIGNSSFDIYSQRYAADGSTVGGEVPVASFVDSAQTYAKVVALDDGGHLIAWQSFNLMDNNTYEIAGQRFDSTGEKVGGEFIVNNEIAGHQEFVSMAVQDDGDVVFVWRSGTEINQKVVSNFGAGSAGAKNLTGTDGNDSFIGSDEGDTLSGEGGDDRLQGGLGDDTLMGGDGDDLFVFADGDGADTISDFTAGAGSDDVIDLMNVTGADSFADVQNAASQSGADTQIDFGNGDTITLLGVNVGDLHEDDFLL